MWASLRERNIEVVKYLVKNGAHTNGMTIYNWASAGWLEKVEESIKNREDINNQSYQGSTALISTSWKEYLEIVKLLVENNANLNLTNMYGDTALMRATVYGHKEIIEYLKTHIIK